MNFAFSILLLLIFAGCIGFLFREGMWGNAIRLVNVVTAALLAMNCFEPLARQFQKMAPSFTFLWDFIALWLCFVLFMVVFRAATTLLSRVKVRFLKIADQIGGVFFAACVGWVMICFLMTSLHTAPLARNFFGGAFRPEATSKFLVFAPDRVWLGFTQKVSMQAFSRGDDHVFDPNGEFMIKYASRRSELEKHMAETDGKIRVRP